MTGVGIIGTGVGATLHVPGFRTSGYDVRGICSADLNRARDAAERDAIPFWTNDARALIERDDVDVVAVASPPDLHRDHVLAAIAAGKSVLCEKPFALSATEAREMLNAAEAAGVVHAVNHEFRYVPARTAVKRLIDGGEFGQIRAIHVIDFGGGWADSIRPRAEWLLRGDQGGGLLGAIGSHWIDTIRWWCGEVVGAFGEIEAFVEEQPLRGGGRARVTSDDTAAVVLRLSSEAIAAIQLSTVVRRTVQRCDVYGSEATATIEGHGRLLFARGNEDLREIVPAPLTDPLPGATGWLPRFLLDAFIELTGNMRERLDGRSDDTGFPTFVDGVKVQEVLDHLRAGKVA